jgi:hypothetical protein
VFLGVHWMTDVTRAWPWDGRGSAVASIALGGRVLSFGRPVEIAQQAAEMQAAEIHAAASPPVASSRR